MGDQQTEAPGIYLMGSMSTLPLWLLGRGLHIGSLLEPMEANFSKLMTSVPLKDGPGFPRFLKTQWPWPSKLSFYVVLVGRS